MANLVKWGAYPALTAYLTTELNALADNARVLGGEIDNTSGLNTYIDISGYVGIQTSRSADADIVIYFITAVDGTNYSLGDASVAPPLSARVGSIALDAAVTARHYNLTLLPCPACKFKILIENRTGQAFTATTNTLGYTVYNREIQ